MISFDRVSKRYSEGHDALREVSVNIGRDELVFITGHSGAGKTTLLRMIAGLETITGGEIAIAGKVVNDLEPRERGCAMVFQNYALYPHMSVRDNMGFSLKTAGAPNSPLPATAPRAKALRFRKSRRWKVRFMAGSLQI